MPIRVALGEDSLIVREGVRRLLAVDPVVEIVAAVGDELCSGGRATTTTRTWCSPTSACHPRSFAAVREQSSRTG